MKNTVKYAILVDGEKVDHITVFVELSECQQDAVVYDYAKRRNLNSFGLNGIKLKRMNGQRFNPHYGRGDKT